jgi:2-polyprenyl-6-methoxyphenol hydroxylase-like FAD-dependent oxidoreductase
MKEKINVGIVGGGIGGIATAVALQQAGIDAVVYEKASEHREFGAGMMLWPNATRVLRGFGLLEDILARSGSSTHFLVRASSGTVLMDIALGEFDVPAICMRRSDLLNILLSTVRPNCVKLGHTLGKLEQSNDRVKLTFEGGRVAEHDLVIGADGIRSRVRSELFGSIEPTYRGYSVWRGLAHYQGKDIRPGSNSETWGAGKRFGILNVGQDKFTWYATANEPPGRLNSPTGWKHELLSCFHQWHKPITDLIAATDDNEILKNGAYDLARLRRWTKGRVTLLGDAAHPCTPNLGQGGGMALEDAAMFAKCLTKANTLEIALKRYEHLRRHRTRHIQQRSRLMGGIGQWENPIVVAGRRAVTGILPAQFFELRLRRVYSYKI